jgi:hypothetical protein
VNFIFYIPFIFSSALITRARVTREKYLFPFYQKFSAFVTPSYFLSVFSASSFFRSEPLSLFSLFARRVPRRGEKLGAA